MTYRIYLVDDDRFLLDLYATKFKNAGHTVSMFGNGEDLITALKKQDAGTPDAVLLDVIMPGGGGFEALEQMRREDLADKAKIIMLTNQGQESDVETAKKLGVDGYIIKASAIPSEVFAETVRIIEGT
jgi:two-component system, sensor histidine kinase